MDQFKLHAPYSPTGDQPEAIEALAAGIERGDKEQSLLGVTGSGKTFTMANIIQKVNRPTPVSYTHLDVYKRQFLFGLTGVWVSTILSEGAILLCALLLCRGARQKLAAYQPVE